MNKLIRAEFYRLFKSKLFYALSGVFAVFATLMRLYVYFAGKASGASVTTDVGIFGYVIIIGVATAIFCSLFIGTEHNDGTIRNKLVVGHTRFNVYISKLIVCFTAGVIFEAIYLIFSIGIGIPLSGLLKTDAKTLISIMLIVLVLTLAFTSIFVMIAMIMHSKSSIAVISLIISFMMIFLASGIMSALNEPEEFEAYSYTENGVTHYEEAMKNPNYLQGIKRQTVEFFYDFLPGCQSMRLAGANEDPESSGIFAFYSAIIILYTTASGIIVFKKKDLN